MKWPLQSLFEWIKEYRDNCKYVSQRHKHIQLWRIKRYEIQCNEFIIYSLMFMMALAALLMIIKSSY